MKKQKVVIVEGNPYDIDTKINALLDEWYIVSITATTGATGATGTERGPFLILLEKEV